MRRLLIATLLVTLTVGASSTSAVGGSDEPPPDDGTTEPAATGQPETIEELIAQMQQDAAGLPQGELDLDANGVPNIPPGEPGDYDIQQGDGVFGAYLLSLPGLDAQTSGSAGSQLHGHCSGFAWSYDDSGNLIDAAVGIGDPGGGDGVLVDTYGSNAGERAFTKGNPYEVNMGGAVVYYGNLPFSGAGPLEHRWYIKTSGISLDKGGDPNTDGENRNAGISDLGNVIPGPARFTGVVEVEGDLNSQNALDCGGHGWVKFVGPFPLLTLPGILASAFFLGGIAGLLFNSRPAQTWRA